MTRATFFVAAVRLTTALPAFRGRTRALLALYRLLGLMGEHIIVFTRVRKPGEFNARLDLHSWLQRICFLTGGYEEDTVRFLSRVYEATNRHGYILDIGANVGLLAIPLAFATQGPSPRVVAVEAAPDNVRALKENLALNGLASTIMVIPLGVGHESKLVEIQVEGNLREGQGSGTANILANGSTYECVRQVIQIETIDQLLTKGVLPPRCVLVKIDTDGYDLNVLRGAIEFLDRERPIVFGEFQAECLRWHGQSIEDVLVFASAREYLVWRRVGRSWLFAEDVDGDSFVQDLLLVPQEVAPRFEWCLRGARRD